MTVSFTARPPWQTTPAELRHAVHCRAGEVVATRDVTGGMSPGPAAVLTLGDGGRVFVKAICKAVSAGSHGLYQQEADILRIIPATVPAARLRGVVERRDWIALLLDAIAGQVAGPPWTTTTVIAAAGACAAMADVEAPTGVPAVVERLPDLDGWTALARERTSLSDWESRHIERLAAATTGWRHWTSGPHLSHQDIRGDNIIIRAGDGRAVLVDWGYASHGASWLDRALLAADVVAAGHEGGPETARQQALELLTDQPPEAARFVIAQAGMWRRNSTLPPHPGMPTHRRWQHQRAIALQPLIEDLL
ncbi:phosphotransferase [Couchioplanes caeruleus]|uniref:phosphotransferase n=1 Tax=Couchioplanes caeruleus TaxID=56438 RepID=UPI0020C13F3B|nr:phosphotransferase [Couchioplanes caeruleus]UQU67441.1 phosphotransferase [Couchioplanes caeruleus]